MLVRRRLGRTASFTRHLEASSKTYDGGIQPNRRTLHVIQLFGCLPVKLPHMVNGIGPGTCLWLSVKGCPASSSVYLAHPPPPGVVLIGGALLQFTAQVQCNFHRLSISNKKKTSSPGHLLYSCPYTGTTAAAASPRTPRSTSRSGKARSSERPLCVVPKKSKLSIPHWDSTTLQAKLPSPGLLPPRLDLLRMAAAAAAPTPRPSSWHLRPPRWKLKSNNSNKGTES